MRTNKTIIGIVLGVSALTFALGVAGFAADEKAVPAKVAMPKFENFDPATYTGETGKIVVPCSGAKISVTLRKLVDGKLGDYLALSGQGRELKAPVGSYKLSFYSVTITGKDGRNWSVNGSGAADDKASTIEVKANESVKLGAETQLQAAIDSGKTGRIKLPCDVQASVSLQYVVDGKPESYLSVSGKGKELAVPVGKYNVNYYFLSSADKSGPRWTINNGALLGKGSRVIDVKAGGKVDLVLGSNEAASLKSGRTGTISLPFEGQSSLRLRFVESGQVGDYLALNGKESKVSIPAGDYELQSCYCTVADKDNVNWSVSLSSAPGKTITVKPRGDTKLAFGQPLTASVDAKQDGDKVSLSLKLASADGTPCSIRRADGKGDPPGFEVLDDSGKVLMSGNFAYG